MTNYKYLNMIVRLTQFMIWMSWFVCGILLLVESEVVGILVLSLPVTLALLYAYQIRKRLRAVWNVLVSDRYILLTKKGKYFYTNRTITDQDLEDFRVSHEANEAVKQARDIINNLN